MLLRVRSSGLLFSGCLPDVLPGLRVVSLRRLFTSGVIVDTLHPPASRQRLELKQNIAAFCCLALVHR